MYEYDPFEEFLTHLTEEEILEAERRAAERFFNEALPGLNGDYSVMSMTISVQDATEEQMRADAIRLGIDPDVYTDEWRDMLIEVLEESFDNLIFEELQNAYKKKKGLP